MNQEIVVVNWFVLLLMVPAAIILGWKVVSDKLKGKHLTSDVTTAVLILALVLIGLLQINLNSASSLWLRLTVLVVQFVLLVFLHKRLWIPLKQLFRGEPMG